MTTVKLSKDARQELWQRLNAEQFSKYQTKIEGAWRFTNSRQDSLYDPHLWIVGAIHGNEAVGAVVLEQLMNLADKRLLFDVGTITFVIGNPRAFLSDVRYIDRDLNRAFALNEENDFPHSVEMERQKDLHFLLAESPPHFVLDLHSVSRGDHGIIVYPEASLLWAERLGCIDTHFCYSKEHMAGETLIDAAHHYGAAAMVVECGHHHSPNTALVALAHIEKLLHTFEMSRSSLCDASLPPFSEIIRYRSMVMIKPYDGFRFLLPVETGTQVEAGVRYAVDARGEHFENFTAWLMMPSLIVNDDDEDAGWLCSRELIPTAEMDQDQAITSFPPPTLRKAQVNVCKR